MKKMDNVFHTVKTAGAVGAFALTLNTCSGPRQKLDGQDISKISVKTDSVLQQNPMYTLSLSVDDLVIKKLLEYRGYNKELAISGATKYIYKNISDRDIRNTLLWILQSEPWTSVGDDGDVYDIAHVDIEYRNVIYKNQRWFDDLMLYLSGKYTDAQLLKSDFFKAIKDEHLYKKFKQNAEFIKELEKTSRIADSYVVSTYDKTWKQQCAEYEKSKQR